VDRRLSRGRLALWGSGLARSPRPRGGAFGGVLSRAGPRGHPKSPPGKGTGGQWWQPGPASGPLPEGCQGLPAGPAPRPRPRPSTERRGPSPWEPRVAGAGSGAVALLVRYARCLFLSGRRAGRIFTRQGAPPPGRWLGLAGRADRESAERPIGGT
jgi:hypothetical protein